MGAQSPRKRTLVDRDAELGVVDDLLGMLEQGRGGVIFAAGEPGIGKTALVGEALERGRRRGYLTLSGRAAEFELELPFAVFVDALDDHVRSSRIADANDRAENAALTEWERAALAMVLPSLAKYAAAEPVVAEPHHVLRAMRMLVESLAEHKPLVLAMDDLHWADTASVGLLCHLLHTGFENPVLLLLAARPAQSQSRLLTALDSAERHGVSRRIELAPLPAAAAEALMHPEMHENVRRALYRESGGNPFYLEQLTAAFRKGQPSDDPRDRLDPPDRQQEIPAAVRAAIEDELLALPELAITLLRGAAVIGDPFEPGPAAETAGVEEADALKALEHLLERDLIRPAEAPRRFRFRHPIVRGAVYAAAGAAWRLGAHDRAAAALAVRGAPAAVRAHHVERSARTGDEDAIAVLIQAGRDAASHAPASAAHWFGAALELIPQSDSTLERRIGLLGERGAALAGAGYLEAGRAALRESLRLSPRRRDPLRRRTVVLAAIQDEVLGQFDSARGLLMDELAALPDGQSAEAADFYREVAFVSFLSADWKATDEWAKRSLAANGEGMARVGALSALALAAYGLGAGRQARETITEAAALFDGLTDAAVTAHHPALVTWLGRAEVCAERFDDAFRHLERVLALSRARGRRDLTMQMLGVQAEAAVRSGRIAKFATIAEAAVEAALLSANDRNLGWALALRCQASLETGDLHGALRSGERGAHAGAGILSPLTGTAPLQLASALLEAGEAARSRDLLLALDSTRFPPDEAHRYELLVRAELMLGRLGHAARFAAHAEGIARTLRLAVPHAQAGRARAMVLLRLGKPRAAAARALASCAAAEHAGAPVEAGRSRMLAGNALAVVGARAAAISVLEDARDRLFRCGAVRRADEAARELRKLGRAVPPRPNRARTANPVLGLTARELQVMERVATGKTNRQIAAELFLSVRTIDRHVSRIYGKLGVNSRAAATSRYFSSCPC